MAIIIPSKNIYKTINPKVIDNVVDNVSVGTSKYGLEHIPNQPIKEINVSKGFSAIEPTQVDYKEETILGYVTRTYANLFPRYLKEYKVEIPKLANNVLIEEIYQGVNAQGKPNIKYSVFYEYTETKYEGSYVYDGGISNPTVLSTKTTEGEGEIPNPYLNVLNEIEKEGTNIPSIGTNLVANIIIDLTNHTNLSSLDISYNKETDKYEATVTVLSGLETFWAYQLGDNKAFGIEKKYIPETVSIYFNGAISTLKLSNDTTTYGGGNKPLSLSGNELLQDSATVGETPLTEHLANNVLNQYASGKETATILCSISDYYDENGNIAISDSQKEVIPKIVDAYTFTETANNFYSAIIFVALDKAYDFDIEVTFTSVSVYINNIPQFVGEVTVKIPKGTRETYQYFFNQGDVSNYPTIEIVFNKELYFITTKELPMSFHIGDVVVPYIYGANGKDRAMSNYKNGKPKEFYVTSSKVYYDGAILQELSLLEKK